MIHSSIPLASKMVQQRQQWQAQNGEMVSFDLFEQMNAGAFQLIGAKLDSHVGPGFVGDRPRGIRRKRRAWSAAPPPHGRMSARHFRHTATAECSSCGLPRMSRS